MIVAGDAHYQSVVALLNCNGANGSTTITDSAPTPKTFTSQGNANISTAQSKYGGASLLLDGAGDWVQTTSNLADFRFGAGNFTCEAWIRTTAGNKIIFDFYGTSQSGGWQLYINSSGYLVWYTSTGGSAIAVATATTAAVTSGSWVHVAACRSGTTLRLFVNGVKVAEASDSYNYNNTTITPFAIGAQVFSRNATYDFSGHIDDVRITKGVARYTADFTPPAVELYAWAGQIAGTVLDSIGSAAARTVRAYRRDTGALAGSTTSNGTTGAYSMNIATLDECSVICLDDSGGTLENDLIHRAIPV